MSYYDHEPVIPQHVLDAVGGPCTEWRTRHINSYWCPTKAFMKWVVVQFARNPLVSMCGSIETPYCRACRNCETRYLQTAKHLRGE